MVQQTVAPMVVARIGWRRRLGTALLAAAALLTFICLLVLVGAWRNDAAIDARTGRATAQVVSSTLGRTVIEFVTPDGVVRSPQRGVLYPRGVEAGQLIRVEYDTSNPDLVRVADRDFRLGLLPVGFTVLIVWLVLAPPALLLRRRAATSNGRVNARGAVTESPGMGGEL